MACKLYYYANVNNKHELSMHYIDSTLNDKCIYIYIHSIHSIHKYICIQYATSSNRLIHSRKTIDATSSNRLSIEPKSLSLWRVKLLEHDSASSYSPLHPPFKPRDSTVCVRWAAHESNMSAPSGVVRGFSRAYWSREGRAVCTQGSGILFAFPFIQGNTYIMDHLI